MPVPSTRQSVSSRPPIVHEHLRAVEALIERLTQSRAHLVPQIRRHLLQAGGKRLRPGLTIMCAKALGEPGERTTLLAACVEIVHTASLLHDDVVDNAHRRRGVVSANRRWGNSAAVLTGDWLVATVSHTLAQGGEHEALQVITGAVVQMCEAELAQMADGGTRWRPRDVAARTEEECLHIIEGKTAALIAAACALGAISVNSSDADRQAVYNYGWELGTAFQIVDDILDIAGEPEALGKPVGTDTVMGQPTLPVVCALRRSSDGLLRRLEEAVRAATTLRSFSTECGRAVGPGFHARPLGAGWNPRPTTSTAAAKQALLDLARAVLMRRS